MGVSTLRRAVFLDRDGILNRAIVRGGKPFAPLTPEDLEILPEAPSALARLKAAGYLLVCVTNQPEIARGALAQSTMDAMHTKLKAELPLDAICVCPHDDGEGCLCRKPKPGLLVAAARDLGIDLSRSYMIGDRWRDVDAAHAAGVTAVFVDYAYTDRTPTRQPDYAARCVNEAVEWILRAGTGTETGTDTGA